MFDTSVVRAHSTAAPRPTGPLILSLGLHLTAILAVVFFSLTATSLPRNPPNQVAQYNPEMLPAVPPPAGNPQPQRKAEPAAAAPARQPAGAITAPQAVPDSTPVLPDAGTEGSLEGSDGPGSNAGVIGSQDGVIGGVGEPGPAEVHVAQPQEPLWPRGEVHPARVLSRVEPRYPSAMTGVRFRNITVVIRCVVDKHGQVRNAEVIHGAYGPFNEAVLEALSQWRFAPGSLRGEAIDTWFELTVNFQIK